MPTNEREVQMSKLELSVLVGAESKEWLASLTSVVERLEKVANVGKKTQTTAAADTEVNEKPAKKTAKPKVTEEEFDLGDNEEAAEDDAPEITKVDLIAACRDNRETAIKVLKKLKVASVHELKPSQYAKVMAEIGA